VGSPLESALWKPKSSRRQTAIGNKNQPPSTIRNVVNSVWRRLGRLDLPSVFFGKFDKNSQIAACRFRRRRKAFIP
jgi:hypothetical protein